MARGGTLNLETETGSTSYICSTDLILGPPPPLSLSTDQPTSSSLLPARPLTTINTSTISGAPPCLHHHLYSAPLLHPLLHPLPLQISSHLQWISPQNFAPQGAQPLQTRGLNISPDEDIGEDHPQAPPPPVLSTPSTPSLLRVKLERAGASDQLAAWVTNYLTDRPQFVRLQDCLSDVVVHCSTGAPKGTVLSPFLFTLYTSDFTYSTDSCHLQKFSDNTAIVGCVSEGNDCEYRKVIMDFVDWCELNHHQVNASNTKETVIDFSRKPSSNIAPVNIQGLDIERVRTYKYQGVHLNKLDWTDNTDLLYKKVVCWERDKKKLNRLIKRANSVCGSLLDSIEVMGERRALAKLSIIMANTS
ncbi:hypothetical protein L3Q82_006857 [Scortum barcoo]|uniref:Uncharacterized protein n=1 Tax=Scortum barcoo TaxID=214431 RepID=A0ACB8WVY3_9TELE|nr:hypothetical protein L3Q82_006857 [Scortum barcoo]